jgi:hypothetical protein
MLPRDPHQLFIFFTSYLVQAHVSDPDVPFQLFIWFDFLFHFILTAYLVQTHVSDPDVALVVHGEPVRHVEQV